MKENVSPEYDLVCLSHLRWDFVYQRPQHLMSRAAKQQRVFFVEEPVFVDEQAHLEVSQRQEHLYIVTPLLPKEWSLRKCVIDRLQPQYIDEAYHEDIITSLHTLLDELMSIFNISHYVLWYYTPMALAFSQHLHPLATMYDCMDELSAFKNAPPTLREHEASLLERANLVFTGGQSLYEAKCALHRMYTLFLVVLMQRTFTRPDFLNRTRWINRIFLTYVWDFMACLMNALMGI